MYQVRQLPIFTSVANLMKNSPYIEKYIKVTWCLHPHVSEKIKKLYVQISNKLDSNDRRYFEILNHKTCQCRGFNKSTAGYKELRKDLKIIFLKSTFWRYITWFW